MASPSSGSPAPLNQPSPRVSVAAGLVQPEELKPVSLRPREVTLEQYLYQEPFAFDFFQAIRLLQRLSPERKLIGKDGPPQDEIVRLHGHISLEFPASSIHQLDRPASPNRPPDMTVAFMGLIGFMGVLPRHYTETLVLQYRNADFAPLRDWLDLFHHRLTSLFYRAWEKYRFYIPYERGEFTQREPDAFSLALFSLIGLGTRGHRNRFRISYAEHRPTGIEEKVFTRLEDPALLRFSGILAHRPRCAVSLEVLLQAYLKMPVKVQQFQGQWLRLEQDSQTALGAGGLNNGMGLNSLVGDRIWDVGSKIRIRLGPMTYQQFLEFLPDRTATPQRKKIYLLAQLVRFYVGMELDFEFQLVLKKEEVPGTKMGVGSRPIGSRLGWNTWSKRKPYPKDADDPVFEVEESVFVNAAASEVQG